MEEEQCTEFHVGSCRQYEALRVRKPRRRCKSWNYNSKIPIDVELPDAENFVTGESVICLSRDGDQLIVRFHKNKIEGTPILKLAMVKR